MRIAFKKIVNNEISMDNIEMVICRDIVNCLYNYDNNKEILILSLEFLQIVFDRLSELHYLIQFCEAQEDYLLLSIMPYPSHHIVKYREICHTDIYKLSPDFFCLSRIKFNNANCIFLNKVLSDKEKYTIHLALSKGE